MADTDYDLSSLDVPRMKGAALKALAALVEKPGVGAPIRTQMMNNLGFPKFRAHLSDCAPAPEPPLPVETAGTNGSAHPIDSEGLATLATLAELGRANSNAFRFPSISDFHRAYVDGLTTPAEVAERFFTSQDEAEKEEPPLRGFIAVQQNDARAQAEASAARWKSGNPLSVLDGIPIAIKDEVDQKGYPTTGGTAFLGAKGAAKEDGTVVAKLRALGAVLVGKTNMHELGIGVTGLNPHHGAVRNPYDLTCFTGGSSSGSAAVVAAGLVPIALGADGGGSIRIPAALCGVVGLKPTWSRVSEHGAVDLCWSVAHLGPITATAQDAAVMFAAIAGEDDKDHHTRHRPAVDLSSLISLAPGADDSKTSDDEKDEKIDLTGMKFGVFDAWFDDSDAWVTSCARQALKKLSDLGAEIVSISIPGLELARIAHLVTIVSEMAASQMGDHAAHSKDYALDTRLNLALARGLTSVDYVQAQRIRAETSKTFGRILDDVDAILTPSTACVAGPLPEDALDTGDSNLRLVSKIMRFAGPANLTGLPAISFPVGYDDAGMPIGLQAMGRAFDEARLLKIALAAESFVQRRRPRFFRTLLPDDALPGASGGADAK